MTVRAALARRDWEKLNHKKHKDSKKMDPGLFS